MSPPPGIFIHFNDGSVKSVTRESHAVNTIEYEVDRESRWLTVKVNGVVVLAAPPTSVKCVVMVDV